MAKAFVARSIPIASFGSVMGIAGLGLAWRLTGEWLPGRVPPIGEWLLLIAAILFLTLLVVWGLRVYSHPDEIRAEQNVAITASYFGTITIACSLLAAGAIPYSRGVATGLWVVAAFGGAALLLYLVGRWIEVGVNAFEMTPSIFIPVVGNATSVYAGVPLGYGDVAWASFAFALMCWLSFGAITLYRLMITEPRLPRKMAPQLAILVSSPAVMASAWYVLTGTADPVFKILTFKGLFFALLTVRLWKMAWGEPYNVAMWGYTFPAAALAAAFVRAAIAIQTPFYAVLATITLAVATIVVTVCALCTLRGWVRQAFETSPLHAT